MDVLAHCRVYPLSNFYRAVPQSLTLPRSVGSHCVSFIHLIEHNFKFTPFKRQIWEQCVKCSVNDGSSVLVIDIVSEWRKIIQESSQGVHYMNSASICNMEGLQNFLMQLQASPVEALQRCLLRDRLNKQISGIIIDNLSYLAHDLSSYSVLIKILKQLRQTYGCWILTIGYGLEYYDGIENSTSTPNRTGALTKLPTSYTNEMDLIILRETSDQARIV